MPNLEMSDWLYLGGVALLLTVALAILKVSYKMKAFAPLPPTKPGFALLPKYVVTLPIETGDVKTELSSRLQTYGFREIRRSVSGIEFTRGSVLGDFSIKIAKVIATASLPQSSPVQLEIGYGVVFGCAFDTGDLWQFCRELTDKFEATATRMTTGELE